MIIQVWLHNLIHKKQFISDTNVLKLSQSKINISTQKKKNLFGPRQLDNISFNYSYNYHVKNFKAEVVKI